jgi:hypothetical protein
MTGLITYGALFGANYFLDLKRHIQRRPVLQINPKKNPYVPEKNIVNDYSKKFD